MALQKLPPAAIWPWSNTQSLSPAVSIVWVTNPEIQTRQVVDVLAAQSSSGNSVTAGATVISNASEQLSAVSDSSVTASTHAPW